MLSGSATIVRLVLFVNRNWTVKGRQEEQKSFYRTTHRHEVMPKNWCENKYLPVDRGRDTADAVPPGGRGGHPSPAPTERSVQVYRTALFRSWFTALWLEPAAPHKGDAAWVAAKGTV